MSNVWSVLGIAATRDVPEIRRAYAQMLRGIDQDKNPEAFMALRQAFNTAMRLAQQAASAPPVLEGVQQIWTPPDAAQQRDDAKIAEAVRKFNEAEAEGDAGPAYYAYRHLVALGGGGLSGSQSGLSPLALRLGLVAARDPSTTTRNADHLLQDIGLDAMTLERHKNLGAVIELNNALIQRMAADSWLEALEKRAALRWWEREAKNQQAAIEVARYMLGKRKQLFGLSMQALLRELDKFNLHRRYAARRLDAARLDRARQLSHKFIYRRSRRVIQFAVFGFFILFAIMRAIMDPSPD